MVAKQSTSEPSTSAGPYLITLIVAALLNLGLRLRILDHFLHGHHAISGPLAWLQRGLLTVFVGLLLLFIANLLARLLPLRTGSRFWSRQALQRLAVLASGMAATNLLSENLAIYRLNLASYTLMVEAFVLYLSITLIFLFWYWHVDNPPRYQGTLWQTDAIASAGSVPMPYGIVFPEESLERDLQHSGHWRPAFIDYCYFTILSSNCFGPPEGHLLVGQAIKKLHIVHSLSMLLVFIVILARAINTLS
jgi:hypothetical protein